MPIGGRPIIVHIIEIFASQGFTDFVLAAGYRKEVLADYFDRRSTDWQIEIVDTGENSDTGRRISCCLDRLGDRFLATYGDGLCDVNLTTLIEAHQKSGCSATLTTVPLRSQFGVVNLDRRGRVKAFLEKPLIPKHWINAGFFVFDKSAFLKWEGESLEMDLLPALARTGDLSAYRHRGFWRAMDTHKDQQELEELCQGTTIPWLPKGLAKCTPNSGSDA